MRAINSAIMKSINRKMVLNHIRCRPISRAELSEQTLLTRASITQIIDELMQEGLVTETAIVGRNHLGRRMTQLALIKDARYIVGLNISRSEYDLGLIDLGGEVIFHGIGAIEGRDINEVLDEICDMTTEAIRQFGIPEDKLCGMGVCAPGPLDLENGTIRNPIDENADAVVSIVEEIKKRIGLDVMLENISNAQALDEMYFGIGRLNTRSFMLLRVDESVDAGFILENNLFTRKNGQNPDIGHIPISLGGPVCTCGNRGCLKTYLSFPRILENTSFKSWKQVVDTHENNIESQELLTRVADHLCNVIISVINFLDIEKIVLSGQFNYRGEILSDMINKNILNRTLYKLNDRPVIAGSKLQISRVAAMPVYHSLFAAELAG